MILKTTGGITPSSTSIPFLTAPRRYAKVARRLSDSIREQLQNVPEIQRETRQEMKYRNVTSLYFATSIAFNDLDAERFPWDDLRTILHGGQRMAKVQKDEEILLKVSTPE